MEGGSQQNDILNAMMQAIQSKGDEHKIIVAGKGVGNATTCTLRITHTHTLLLFVLNPLHLLAYLIVQVRYMYTLTL